MDNSGLQDTLDHTRRVWKAYHERQALLAGRRQYSRPVDIDPLLWGDLLTKKLSELVEGERNHPRSVVRGGAADRNGGHCLLPGMCPGTARRFFSLHVDGLRHSPSHAVPRSAN